MISLPRQANSETSLPRQANRKAPRNMRGAFFLSGRIIFLGALHEKPNFTLRAKTRSARSKIFRSSQRNQTFFCLPQRQKPRNEHGFLSFFVSLYVLRRRHRLVLRSDLGSVLRFPCILCGRRDALPFRQKQKCGINKRG